MKVVHTKSGITLIELVVGLLLSSLILTALFTVYGTISRTVARAQVTMERDHAVAIFQHQWRRDIQGVFAPPYPEKEIKKTKEQDVSAAKTVPDKTPAPAAEKKEKPKPIKKIFDATQKDATLQALTFISTNPIAVYEKSQTGSKPRMVRIVYRLESDGKKPASYRLMRQESDTLEFDAFSSRAPKPIKAYELLANIKKLTIEFMVEKQEKQEQKEKEKKKGRSFKSFAEWHSDERFKEEKEVPLIPDIMRTTLVLADADTNQERTYHFDYVIPAAHQKIPVAPQTAPQMPLLGPPPVGQKPSQPQAGSPGRGLFLPQSPRLTSLLDQIEKKIDQKLGMK